MSAFKPKIIPKIFFLFLFFIAFFVPQLASALVYDVIVNVDSVQIPDRAYAMGYSTLKWVCDSQGKNCVQVIATTYYYPDTGQFEINESSNLIAYNGSTVLRTLYFPNPIMAGVWQEIAYPCDNGCNLLLRINAESGASVKCSASCQDVGSGYGFYVTYDDYYYESGDTNYVGSPPHSAGCCPTGSSIEGCYSDPTCTGNSYIYVGGASYYDVPLL